MSHSPTPSMMHAFQDPPHAEGPPNWGQSYSIGTRRVSTRAADDHRVSCASCDAGGTIRHRTRAAALTAATNQSMQPCRTCGAD